MERIQIYNLVNTITEEVLGTSALVKEDLSNTVDVGTALFNANAVDNYVRSLVNHIAMTIFVDRPYSGNVPSVMMNSFEFASVIEKISGEIPEATENESWELENNTSYDPNIFYKPTVEAKFFNKRVTFEVPMSFTERQVKDSFSNAVQLNGFISMLYNLVDKSMTVKMDGLIMRAINNMIGETVYDDYGTSAISSKSGVKAVNLLKLYNSQFSKSLTANDMLTDPDFIRYASYQIGVYASRLTKLSTLFNIDGKERFTPSDLLHVVLLSDFKRSADVYLQSTTFHNEFTNLPKSEEVPYWQGSGTSYAFADTGKVYITTGSGVDETVTGIIGVMFDRDALGVSALDRHVTSNYNPKAEFYTNWNKFTAGVFNDTAENFVVFFGA